jgi:hypothetical protein
MATARQTLELLNRRLKELVARRPRDHRRQREYFVALRKAFALYEDVVGRRRGRQESLTRPQFNTLRRLAARAFDELGGQPEPATRTLREYDHERLGPYLGVSGEESAAPAIRDAALSSPKVRALGLTQPIEVGVAHDAERLGSVGELPVGPDEYRDIRLECLGRILTSTNVGARLNVRFYARLPVVWVNPGPLSELLQQASLAARRKITPFLDAPDHKPRPVTVFVQFRAQVSRDDRLAVLRALVDGLRHRKIGDPDVHSIGLLAKVRKGSRGVSDSMAAISLACEAGITTVAVEGVVRAAAEDIVSMPGLLQYFNSAQTSMLLDHAARNKVRLTPKNIIDTQTLARQTWTALTVARNAGMELGKYGLFPLTLVESEQVVEAMQRWLPSWCAAPAFYVDVPAVMNNRVFSVRDMPEAIEAWLRMVARHGVRIVLIDTVQKSKGQRLMKEDRRDKHGILSAEQIRVLDVVARSLGICVLWAGGITLAQAYEFGRMGAFGIYVTTAAAVPRPVSPAHKDDVALAAERLPTREGVYRVKLLLEAGFLVKRLIEEELQAKSIEIERAVGAFLASLDLEQEGAERDRRAAARRLDTLVLDGWKLLKKVA